MIIKDMLEILAGSVDGVYAVDMRQKIVFWNKSAERILGYEAEEMLSRYCYDVFTKSITLASSMTYEELEHPCRENCISVKFARNMQAGESLSIPVITKDRIRKWINLTHVLFPAINPQLGTLIHIFHDVTSDKEAINLVAKLGKLVDDNMNRPNNLVDDDRKELDPLTERERQVLKLLAKGMNTREVAEYLVITNNTTRNHIQRIIAKMGVHSRLEAVTLAYRQGTM
jgi:PAS domain S-box-containing protein